MESEQPYYDNEDYGGRVLWGRVAFFGITLLLAFFLGRCTSDGVPPEQLVAAENRNEELSRQIDELESELESVQSENADGAQGGENENATNGEASGNGGSEGSNSNGSAADTERTHVVERGETLSELADRYYGDGDKHTLITEANDIDEDNPLQVGQELVIPPDPEA